MEPAVNRDSTQDAAAQPAVVVDAPSSSGGAAAASRPAAAPVTPCCHRGTYTMCVHQDVLDFEPSDEDEPTLAECFE